MIKIIEGLKKDLFVSEDAASPTLPVPASHERSVSPCQENLNSLLNTFSLSNNYAASLTSPVHNNNNNVTS